MYGVEAPETEGTLMDINLERVVETATEVVGERGENYIYEKPINAFGTPVCVYVYESQPSCLVGHILHRLGVPLETLGEGDRLSFSASDVCMDLLAGTSFYDTEISAFLDSLQSEQDTGHTWGEALQVGLSVLADTRGAA
jgi:hypothetical protein